MQECCYVDIRKFGYFLLGYFLVIRKLIEQRALFYAFMQDLAFHFSRGI